jgi:hypothetical protein
MTNPTDTTVRMTDRLSIAVDEISSTEKYSSKKTFVQSALSENVFSVHSKIEGYKPLKHFTVRLNSDVTWFNLDVKDTGLTAKLDISSKLTSAVRFSINDSIQSIINSIVSSSDLSQSSVIRICIIKHCYNCKNELNSATQMEITDRWFSIKNKLTNMVERLIVNLHFELQSERIMMKTDCGYENRNIHHIECHYKQLRESKAYDVIKQTHHGKKVINTLKNTIK